MRRSTEMSLPLCLVLFSGLHYKTLWIHNVRKIDRIHSFLLLSINFSGLEKRTSLLRNTHIMNRQGKVRDSTLAGSDIIRKLIE
jgi:hypothetical protein